MLNSSNFNTTFPSFYEDNNNNITLLSQPSDEINNPFYHYDHIQSPLFYYDMENYMELLNNHDLTMIQEPLQATNSSVVTDDSSILEVTTNKMDSTKGDEVSVMANRPSSSIRGVKRRRTSNKDRHSKIRTAHGLRDRRMRLSLEVAKPFFELQDILGFDKASKTVEWLLNQSKIAIDEVIVSKFGSPSGVTKCTISSTSDCEGESIVVDQKNGNNNNNNNNNRGEESNNKRKKSMVNVAKEGKNKEKRLRTTKEAMKKARDKARKRTLEKMQSRGIIIKEQNDAKSHPLALGDCEVIQGNNDANTMNHINGHCLGGGGDFVDVSLMQNWNSSTNFSY